MPVLIGLTGLKQSGKSTVAQALVHELGYVRVALSETASPIKSARINKGYWERFEFPEVAFQLSRGNNVVVDDVSNIAQALSIGRYPNASIVRVQKRLEHSFPEKVKPFWKSLFARHDPVEREIMRIPVDLSIVNNGTLEDLSWSSRTLHFIAEGPATVFNTGCA